MSARSRRLLSADLRGASRGVPTAWSAPPPSGRLAGLDERRKLDDALRARGARVRREAAEALHESLAVAAAP